jgi:2,4-dienoyl-CoA reductase-like NADH-dependent reductase (Old Yellow Enzyme family)
MLHQPLTFRSGAVAPNRVALAAMTNMQSQPDGLLGDDELTWLAHRADGHYGMIATCAAYVAKDGKAWEGELAIDRDETLPGLTRLATRLRVGGGLSVVQLFHGGVRAVSKLTGEQVWSASTWEEQGKTFEVPRPATEDDLRRVIDQFAAAAARAERAGFDGVELHGAHGYLLSQFLSRTMNPRDDGWGGDLIGRARLIREATRAVRARTKPGFLVGVRLSLEDFGNARGMDLDDNLQVARWLCDDGADFLHASLWDVTAPTKKRPEAHPLALLRAALPAAIRILTAGGVWSPAEAEAALAHGADMIALGRAAILNPRWPDDARDPSWQPMRPPITQAGLLERGVSPLFAGYLGRWKGLVEG